MPIAAAKESRFMFMVFSIVQGKKKGNTTPAGKRSPRGCAHKRDEKTAPCGAAVENQAVRDGCPDTSQSRRHPAGYLRLA